MNDGLRDKINGFLWRKGIDYTVRMELDQFMRELLEDKGSE